MQRARTKDEQGFTLIELLIVILVLAILATIVVFAAGHFTGEGTKSACEANAKIANIASAVYATHNDGAPGDSSAKIAPYIQDGFPTENAPSYSGGRWVAC